MLSVLARKWNVKLPDEATVVLARTDLKYGFFSTGDVPSRSSSSSPNILNQHSANITFQKQSCQSIAANGSPIFPDPIIIPAADPKQVRDQNVHSRNLNIDSMVLPPDGMIPTTNANHLKSSLSNFTESQPSTSMQTPQTSVGTASNVSPNSMLGGVESLVENQDWWLGDQASLAVGFDNWNGIDASMMNLQGGSDEGYFMPSNAGSDAGNGGLGNEGWYA